MTKEADGEGKKKRNKKRGKEYELKIGEAAGSGGKKEGTGKKESEKWGEEMKQRASQECGVHRLLTRDALGLNEPRREGQQREPAAPLKPMQRSHVGPLFCPQPSTSWILGSEASDRQDQEAYPRPHPHHLGWRRVEGHRKERTVMEYKTRTSLEIHKSKGRGGKGPSGTSRSQHSEKCPSSTVHRWRAEVSRQREPIAARNVAHPFGWSLSTPRTKGRSPCLHTAPFFPSLCCKGGVRNLGTGGTTDTWDLRRRELWESSTRCDHDKGAATGQGR